MLSLHRRSSESDRHLSATKLVCVCGFLFCLNGCQYAYLQMYRSKALLPLSEVAPQVSNKPSVVVSGSAAATNGKDVSYADGQNYTLDSSQVSDGVAAEFTEGYENVVWVTPQLSGMAAVTCNTGKLLSISVRGSLARVHGEYSYGGALGVGLAYCTDYVGGKLEIEAGRSRTNAEATILIRQSDYYGDDSTRIVETDYDDSRIGVSFALNTVKPILTLHLGGRIKLQEIFAYSYKAEDNRVRLTYMTVAPTAFCTKLLGPWGITAGYTFVGIIGNQAAGSVAGTHVGWLQMQYSFALPEQQ
jgi:hypothetical protein